MITARAMLWVKLIFFILMKKIKITTNFLELSLN